MMAYALIFYIGILLGRETTAREINTLKTI